MSGEKGLLGTDQSRESTSNFSYRPYENTLNMRVNHLTDWNTTYNPVVFGQRTIIELGFGEHISYSNNNLISVTKLTTTMPQTDSLQLFWGRYNYSPTPAIVYGFQIFHLGSLILNFIPCYRKSDNEPGMYDTVNNVFYTNAGTGTFIIGNDVN